jgi:uncharacterized membrane protein YqaE (UPF0057 family)
MVSAADLGLFVVAFFLPPLAVCESPLSSAFPGCGELRHFTQLMGGSSQADGPRALPIDLRSCSSPRSPPAVIQKDACDRDVLINILLTLLIWLPGDPRGSPPATQGGQRRCPPHLGPHSSRRRVPGTAAPRPTPKICPEPAALPAPLRRHDPRVLGDPADPRPRHRRSGAVLEREGGWPRAGRPRAL